MKYKLVIPRDFFNQSKLLKCLGKLSIHVDSKKFYPITVFDELKNPDSEFVIEQNEDGDLFCKNYRFVIEKLNQKYELSFHIPYNSKRNFPLYCGDVEVLDDNGNLMPEFIKHIKTLQK